MVQLNRDDPVASAFGLKLNKQDVTKDVAAWIANVVVEDDLNIPGMFTLELLSKEDLKGITPWTDDTRFDLGAEVQVSFGYGDRLEVVIAGQITALEPVFSISGPPTLIVRGYDTRRLLNAARHSRSFVTQKDSAVAEEIGKLAGVTLKATDSGVTHPYLLQAGQTDLEFLLERARRIQYELAMDSDGATVLFRPVANAAKEVATLTLDDHLLEFRPRLSLVPVTQLTVRGWDPKESQPVTASSRAGDQKLAPMGAQKSSADYAVAFHRETAGSKVEPWLETMVRDPVASAAEADQMAVGRFNAAALDFIRGDGRCRGRTDMRAGKVVRIDRIGSRFSGPYYVTSAVHSYTRRGGYITTFQVRRNAS